MRRRAKHSQLQAVTHRVRAAPRGVGRARWGLWGPSALLLASCVAQSDSPVRLNEVMPANQSTCADESGKHDDWIELFNSGAEDLDLEGYALTDDTTEPRKSVLGAGLAIAAGGTLRLWADGTPEQGARHLAFRLGAQAEEVALYDPEGRRVDETQWADAAADTSWGRAVDGTGPFVWCAAQTCGEPNGTACAAP